MKIWGIRVSFGCERSCSSHRRVSNFNSKVPQEGIYPQIKFERDRFNICRVRVFASSGSTGGRGGGDAKTIISPNTSFGDIMRQIINNLSLLFLRNMNLASLFLRKNILIYFFKNLILYPLPPPPPPRPPLLCVH